MNATIQTSPMLSEKEQAQFVEDGFLVINDVLGPAEIEEFRAIIESPELSAVTESAGLNYQTVHLLGLTARHPRFRELAADPRIIQRLIPLIGPDIQLQHSKLAAQARTKGKGGFHWHQDFAFFPHTNTDLVAVMVMLDDATEENGCMHMVRGSHRLGVQEHAVDGRFAGSCQCPEIWESQPEKVAAITPRVGGISIHHCLTLHGSGPNASGLPRRGIVFQYRADDAFQMADAVFPDTGLVVAGNRRAVVRCSAMTIPLPFAVWRNENNRYGDAWHQEGAFAHQENEKATPV